MTALAGVAGDAGEPWLVAAQAGVSAGIATTAGSWVARFTVYLTLTVVVGGLVTAAWVVPDTGGTLPPVARQAARIAAWAALAWALATAALLLFGLAGAAGRPVVEVLRWELLSPFLARRFGAMALLTAVVALLVAGLAAAATTRAGAAVALVGAALGALGPALWGHAGGAGPFAVAADALHVLGAAAWVGGLGALVAVVLGSGVEPLTPTRRFSDLALVAFAVVGLSGVATASLHLDEPGQLLDTSWGRLVLVKLALFGVIAVIAWNQRRRRVPALAAGGDAARRAFRRLAAVELVVMGAALAAAATMASGMPADVEAASRVQTLHSAFGDGWVELSFDPAATGDNVVDVSWRADDGGPLSVQNPRITLSRGEVVVDVRLFVEGPGRDTAPLVTIPEAGSYTVTVAGSLGGRREEATGTVRIR